MKSRKNNNLASILQILFLLIGAVVVAIYILPSSPSTQRSNSPSSQKQAATSQDSLHPDTAKERPVDGAKQEPDLTVHKEGLYQRAATLYALSGADAIHLLDHRGKSIHTWPLDATRARLMPDCSLLVVHGSKYGLRKKKWRELKYVIRRYGWNGDILWEKKSENWFHHDIHELSNGNILTLERLELPFPEKHPFKPKIAEKSVFRSDAIVEIDPSGETVWRWDAHEHLDTVSCGWNGCEKSRKKKGGEFVWDWTHTNTAQPLGPNRHFAAGDLRFHPSNIFILPRNFWTAYLIDRDSGQVVWTYEGEPKDGKLAEGMVRGHEAHMIPEGLPGAGNVLILDNGYPGHREYSKVLEVDPQTNETVWKYEKQGEFFTYGGGSVQRLSSGNTFISEDTTGRAFEVTPEGEIVWEVRGNYRISRAHRYPYDYCGELEKLNPDQG
ncbi:MAG: aryl-sulfate sulfotransferase [Bdellovibrionales bacterium]|nr:aryl-sulfate sulfotransferase [Bdellovibrionales bacterium]